MNTQVIGPPPNTFTQTVTFLGDVIVRGSYIDFHRNDVGSYSGIRYFRDDDTAVGAGGRHYCELGMDMAVGGYYWAFYDNRLDEDILKIAVDGPLAGRFNIGRDNPVMDQQLNIHDLDERVNYSIGLWSWNHGIYANSRNPYADSITIPRDDSWLTHWLHFHQGNGWRDWRMGMGANTYDLFLYCGTGPNTDAKHPGRPILRFSANDVEALVPFTSKEITDLQNQVDALKSRILALEKTCHENHLL